MNRIRFTAAKLYRERRILDELESLVLDSGICLGTFLFVFILFNMVIK